GTPASTSLTVHLPGTREQQVSTDSGGVAVIDVNAGAGIESLHVEADDHHGNRTTSNIPLENRSGDDQILLRTNRAVLKAGDRIALKIIATPTNGPPYTT